MKRKKEKNCFHPNRTNLTTVSHETCVSENPSVLGHSPSCSRSSRKVQNVSSIQPPKMHKPRSAELNPPDHPQEKHSLNTVCRQRKRAIVVHQRRTHIPLNIPTPRISPPLPRPSHGPPPVPRAFLDGWVGVWSTKAANKVPPNAVIRRGSFPRSAVSDMHF